MKGFRWCPHCKGMHALEAARCPVNGATLDSSLVRRLRVHEGMVLGGHYRLLHKLGEGGNGVVYEAHNLRLSRVVAVKLLRLHEDMDDDARERAIRRLMQEAQLASAAGHPNICTVLDVGKDAELPYIVMEKCVGITLSEAIARRKSIRVALALDMMAQILSAVDAAHRANVVHRDLKPRNIFLVPRVGCSPIVKVLDFGLAKNLAGSANVQTQNAIALGTPMYMAPEQLAGARADYRSDLYSCGLVLVEMLTGRLPRSSQEILSSGAGLDPAPPSAAWRGKGFGGALEEVIAMSLQADPSHRFQSAQEFQIALLAGLPWALDARELFEPMSSAKLPSLEQDSVPTSARKVGLSEHDQTAVGATGEPIEQDALVDEPTYRMGADET